MNEFRVDVARTIEAVHSLEEEWRALEQHVVLPFASFDWTVAWLTHMRSRRLVIRDDLLVLTFRSASGDLIGVAPMLVTTRPNAGPFSVRQLQFVGADTNITELRCITTAAHNLQAVYTALLSFLRTGAIRYDWIKLTGVPAGSGLMEAAGAQFGGISWSREVPNFYLELKPTWEEFRSGLSRNIKESLRKCYNSPKRDGLEFKFNVITDEAQQEEAVKTFLRLHGQRAQLTGTVAHPDVFRSEESRRFLLEVCRRFARQGRLHVFQMKLQDNIIATRIGLGMGDCLYLYYSGYDPGYSKYSVMTTTVAEAIQYAIAKGFKTVNLSIGRDVSKERWSPVEVMYHELEVVSPALLGGLKYRMFKAASDILKTGWLGKLIARNEA